MSKCIYGNTVGAGGGLPKSFLLETEDGVQLVGVAVGEETVFDATPNDVRVGKIYAGEDGVETGEKVIPSYHTLTGAKIIPPNSRLVIPNQSSTIEDYDYTQLQAIICSFNSDLSNSVGAEQVSIGNVVYNVQSVDALSIVTKNHDSKQIDFGFINEFNKPCIIRYFMYKEID